MYDNPGDLYIVGSISADVLGGFSLHIQAVSGWHIAPMAGLVFSLEQAFKTYANQYNWKHSRRKISWRRLNKLQRQQAVLNQVLYV